ncbi:MAG: efflux RND transporter periplasmic adaptor subunit [Parachlamydiaceae bacterium]|nr:efflux RND transporter periplasmic adaptor subunit [Parachlamydiaceae bacterium]
MKIKNFAFRYIILSLAFFYGCNSNPKQEAPTYPVKIADVIQKDVPIYIDVIGNVNSLDFIKIRPQVTGIIQEAFVEQGQYVKKGDPLYKIDPRPFQANLDKAKASLIKDQATLKFNEERVARYNDIVKKEYLSQLEYDQFVSNVELSKGQILSDQADIDLAQINLEWTTPTSPIDGKISQYNIDPGNLVTANDPNAFSDIRTITPADIHFNIAQNDFVKVQKSMENKKKQLKFLALLPQAPTKPREGEIYFIDNHIDTTTGTILLKGTVPNEDEMFWPGEFVKIKIELRVQPNAILIPVEAIKVGQDGPYVYVYLPETSTVEYRLIVKGDSTDHMVLVEKGVNAGEKIVTQGQLNLRPGNKVYIPTGSSPK